MQGPYKTCLHQDSYTSLNAAPYWKNGQPFDILFFDFHLKECWASTAVKNYSHIKTKLKKNGRGKKYSKGVGPFRFQLSEFQNCPASDMLPQTLKFYLSNAKPYYHRADARWLSPSAFVFFQRVFSGSKRGAFREGTCDTRHFKHDTPTRKQSLFHNRCTWIFSCYHAPGLKLLVNEISSFGTL